jgi:uncharacterized protein (UPF0147 family)
MFQLITLAMLPHEVMQHFINEKDDAITLTSPDRFVIDETIPRKQRKHDRNTKKHKPDFTQDLYLHCTTFISQMETHSQRNHPFP